MTDKELRKLHRSELLEMMLEQEKEIEKLKKRLEEAEEKLAQREITIKESGNLAEAAIGLNEVFETAQHAVEQILNRTQTAADEYLSNVKVHLVTDGVEEIGELEESEEPETVEEIEETEVAKTGGPVEEAEITREPEPVEEAEESEEPGTVEEIKEPEVVKEAEEVEATEITQKPEPVEEIEELEVAKKPEKNETVIVAEPEPPKLIKRAKEPELKGELDRIEQRKERQRSVRNGASMEWRIRSIHRKRS